jgi:hypothetical protein
LLLNAHDQDERFVLPTALGDAGWRVLLLLRLLLLGHHDHYSLFSYYSERVWKRSQKQDQRRRRRRRRTRRQGDWADAHPQGKESVEKFRT